MEPWNVHWFDSLPSTNTHLIEWAQKEADLWQREELAVGDTFAGPAIIAEQVATTWLAEGWRCEVDAYGNLMLSRCSY